MELFDFGIPALDKALNLTATVLLLLALGMLLIRVILRLCDRAFDRSERLAPFRTICARRCAPCSTFSSRSPFSARSVWRSPRSSPC